MKMFQGKVSLVLALSLFANTALPQGTANASLQDYKLETVSVEKKIADTFNKFRYEMSVEWDQQDPYFKDQAEKEFENSLIALKSQGVTDIEIQAYMEKNHVGF